MRRHLQTVGGLLLVIALLAGLWKLNVFFGRRTGEIDRGRWYLIEGTSGQHYYQKGIDPGNQFLDHQEAEDMVTATPGYLRTEKGFGAVWIKRGWLKDAYLSSSGWKLFATEDEAVESLKKNGVKENDIYFAYR